MAVHILAPLVAEFRRLYPKVVLDITVDSPLVPPIEDYDLTILGAGRLYDANVVARPVIVSEGLLCASPRYLRSAGTPRRIGQQFKWETTWRASPQWQWQAQLAWFEAGPGLRGVLKGSRSRAMDKVVAALLAADREGDAPHVA